LLTIITKSFLTTLVLVGIFQFVADFSVPLVPLSIGVAMVSGLMVSISWSIISMRVRVAVLLIPLAFAFLALIAYVGNESRGVSLGGSTSWTIIKWGFYLLGGLGMLAAMPLVVRGVESQRHVVGLRSRMGLASKEQANLRPARLASLFRHPFSALVWLELKGCSLRVFFWAALINTILALFLYGMTTLNPQSQNFSVGLTYAASTTCTTYLLFAILGSAQNLNNRRIPTFLGAKPVSNQQLAFAKLSAVLIHLLIGCLIGALFIFAFLTSLGFRLTDVSRDLAWINQFATNLGWKWSWLVAMSLISISVAIGVIGFGWVIFGIRYGQLMLICLLASLGVFAFAVWDAYSGWQYPSLRHWLGLGLTLFVTVTVTALAWKTIASKQIDARMVRLVVAFWILSLGMFYSVISIAAPDWNLPIFSFPTMLFILVTWIPAGLAISLPWIVARLRHAD
jgi:hypothetical protein